MIKNSVQRLLLFVMLLFSHVSEALAQFNCGDSLIDFRDGSNYHTILIGNRCWMQQNLNYGHMVSSHITGSTHSDMHNDSIPEKYAPDGDSINLLQYGALYEWDELMDYTNSPGARGLCPAGWHVPTDAEWLSMLQIAGVDVTNGTGGNNLKEIGQGTGIGAGNNSSGFSARAAGDRDAFGIFYGLGLRFIFWTSTAVNNNEAVHYTLWEENDTIEHLVTQKITGLSCRCIQDSMTTGINAPNDKFDIIIFPNPANDFVQIKNNSNYEINSISVYDVYGEKVITYFDDYIDVRGISNGVYFLIGEMASGNNFTRRILVIH